MIGTGTQPKINEGLVTALLSGTLIEALDRYIVEDATGKTRSEALSEAFKQCCIDRRCLDPTDG